MEMRIFAFFHVFIVLSGFLFDIREPLSQDELAKRHRIVTLSPHLAEIVYASGAGDYVVGVIAGSNYPSDATRHPVVGGFNGIDFEVLISLEPTMVLAWEQGNRKADILKLERLGIPVRTLSAATLIDLENQIYDVSRLFGTDNIGDRVIASHKNKILSFDRRLGNDVPRQVFIKIWDRPIFTIGHDHYINDALKLCGMTNVGEQYPFSAGSVSIETMLLSGADFILNLSGLKLVEETVASIARYVDPSLSMRTIDGDSERLMRLSPRFLDGLEALCADVMKLQGGS
jgi:ABC-type Fe3+-hydroxamate transport system substrate-binding protein